MTALMLLGMGCTFASCGSDDDDDTQGNREVAELKAMLLDENGQVFFEAMGGSDYKIGLLSKEDAIDLIKLYVGSDFTGQPRITLMDTDSRNSRITLNVNSRVSLTYNWSDWFVCVNGNFYHSRYHYKNNRGQLNEWSAMLRFGVRL